VIELLISIFAVIVTFSQIKTTNSQVSIATIAKLNSLTINVTSFFVND